MSETGEGAVLPRDTEAARKRAAIETYSRYEIVLRRTARRYSLCPDDADDALQRALEILLTKAPSDDPRELIRWTQTVVKHEALAVRHERERLLGGSVPPPHAGHQDPVASIPSDADGPAEQAERREAVARSREALQALKPQELRALTLLAEGYSYAEIGEITNFSMTKVNRCLAEGRERYRRVVARSETGGRCEEMRPLLSAFCDGEASEAEGTMLREHLRACAGCRATLRAYRAAPAAAAALAPALPPARSLLERAHDALAGLAARFGGGGDGGADSALSQVAANGGARGAGIAALGKAVAICVGTAGGAVACVATGVVPAPPGIAPNPTRAATIERRIDPELGARLGEGIEYETAPPPVAEQPPIRRHEPKVATTEAEPLPEPAPATAGAVEYAPEPEPAPVADPAGESAPAGSGDGNPAGEFGP